METSHFYVLIAGAGPAGAAAANALFEAAGLRVGLVDPNHGIHAVSSQHMRQNQRAAQALVLLADRQAAGEADDLMRASRRDCPARADWLHLNVEEATDRPKTEMRKHSSAKGSAASA